MGRKADVNFGEGLLHASVTTMEINTVWKNLNIINSSLQKWTNVIGAFLSFMVFYRLYLLNFVC